jgi:hypothetical protein
MQDIVKKIIVPVTLILALAGVVLVWARGGQNAQLLADARQVQNDLNGIQVRRMVFQRLVQDVMLYSQQQPAIDPLLIQLGLKPAPPQPQPRAQQPAQQQSAPSTTPRR